MLVYTYKPSTWEAEQEDQEFKGICQLYNELKTSLNYVRPCLKNSLIFKFF